MGHNFKETSKFNVDQKKYESNWERIFGNKKHLCQTGVEQESCSEKVAKEGGYCDNCKEANYQNGIEAIIEGVTTNGNS